MPDLSPLQPTFVITIEMLSDWHIGAGNGRPGDIDRLVRRDSDGLPYIPAKTLTGIWRDACETVAYALDHGKPDGPWHRLLVLIFGDQTEREDDKSRLLAPRPARISIRAARLDKSLRQAMKSKPLLREAATFVKPGIMINPRTGGTRKDYLRYEEMARRGAVLTSTVELTLPEGLDGTAKMAATALLVAGSSFVERVGGKRRRGAGRCRMTVDGFSDLKPIADWLENNREPVLNLKNERQSESPAPGDHVDGNWVKVTLKITALCPLIIPERTIGNLVKTLDYIPGTYLLPFISSKLKEVDIRSAIANGDVIVTNATPSVDGVAGRPTPLNLYYRKLDGGLSRGRGVLNRFSETDDGPQLKPHRGGYVGATAPAKLPTYLRTGLSVETHNVVEDNSQRPTSDVGGVFSYQSIDEGTECYAEIRLRESLARRLADHDSHWKSLLNDQRYRIGRARKDEYGAVKIELQNTDGQYRLQLENQEIPAEIRVWLLSDLLLRDERLRPTTSIARLAVELGARLGVSLELRRGQPDDCHQTGAGKIDFAVRTHRIDSWHTGWGLPRPSLIGLSAGSCFVFDIKKTDPSTSPEMFHQNLTDVAANGIGDRRAEGYGQICFDDPLLSGELGKIEINIVQESRPSADVRIPMTPYAHLIQIEAWRREIRRCAASLAMDPKSRRDALGMNAKPRMSQWGALRSVLTQVRKCQDSQIVENWFARVGKSENRSEEWPKETVDKVKKLVNDQSLVWNLLKNEDLGLGEVTLTFDGEVLVSKELWAEAVRTVVDACIRAHQRDREKSSKRIANQQTN